MDESVPLLERLKFISIFSTNLDEFFMIRVGSLFDISSINPEHIDNKSGMTASEQLDSIYQVIPGLVEKKRRIYSTVSTQLEKYGVKDVPYEELTEEELDFVRKYFDMEILPILSPQVIDNRHPKQMCIRDRNRIKKSSISQMEIKVILRKSTFVEK